MAGEAARSAFERGCAYVEAKARPLDVALLRHRLGQGGTEAVVVALGPFQNADGGFGHGLEPDLSTPASSAIATSVAFQALRGAGAQADEPMVQRGLQWLEAAFDWDRGVWPIIGPDVDLAPHAFWWDWDEDLASRWNGFRFNPSVELLGVLYAYLPAAPERLIERAEQALLEDLAAGRRPEGAYDLKCALRLVRTAAAPGAIRGPIEALIRAAVAALDPDDTHAPALDLAPQPGEPLADLMADRIDAAFERLLAEQQPDGSWAPFWDWSAVDAQAWADAEGAWRGVLTRQAVEALHAYDRIGR
ncbi:MAG: hypothetical protein P4L73_11995 [Caulobacteraceae bacterium]|nr:hypothetical protein [Caulobacteraceae bacterium]